jgi:hypothetical protein
LFEKRVPLPACPAVHGSNFRKNIAGQAGSGTQTLEIQLFQRAANWPRAKNAGGKRPRTASCFCTTLATSPHAMPGQTTGRNDHVHLAERIVRMKGRL